MVKSCCPAKSFPDLHSTGRMTEEAIYFPETHGGPVLEAHPCNTASTTEKQKDAQVDELPQRSWQILRTLI